MKEKIVKLHSTYIHWTVPLDYVQTKWYN